MRKSGDMISDQVRILYLLFLWVFIFFGFINLSCNNIKNLDDKDTD